MINRLNKFHKIDFIKFNVKEKDTNIFLYNITAHLLPLKKKNFGVREA